MISDAIKAHPEATSWGALRRAAGLPDGRRNRPVYVELTTPKPTKRSTSKRAPARSK
jgi:hypothetical protein